MSADTFFQPQGGTGSMQNGTRWKHGIFLAVFGVLTLLCWCPIGYGPYGPVPRVLGMPNWAVTGLAIGGIMFLLELVFLFGTGLTLDDEELPGVIKAIHQDIHP
jgi:hypothetical protein